jgi:pSer/pThr/pTyr-binding forkhead associated (FHA) protein
VEPEEVVLAVLIRRPLIGEPSERFPVRQAEVAIGRVGGNDVVIDDPSMSARHARLRLAGGVWTIADLGSVNGSRVDGEPVQQALPLAPGSILRLGAVELAFAPQDRWQDSPSEPPAKVATPPEGVASYVLEVTERREIPVAVLIGLTVIALGVIGYLLARGG